MTLKTFKCLIILFNYETYVIWLKTVYSKNHYENWKEKEKFSDMENQRARAELAAAHRGLGCAHEFWKTMF